jgi:hypothetical protein
MDDDEYLRTVLRFQRALVHVAEANGLADDPVVARAKVESTDPGLRPRGCLQWRRQRSVPLSAQGGTGVNGDDLKRMQDDFIEKSKKLLLEHGHMRPMGFIVTLSKHLDKRVESGWGLAFIAPKTASIRDDRDDQFATIVIDLSMNWEKLYHAVLAVFPKTQNVLPELLRMAEEIKVDDPYMRLMRPFMSANRLDEKDVVAAVMRQICDKVDAFASIFHSEAWLRAADSSKETIDDIYKNAPNGLEHDQKSVEIIVSTMETHVFARMVTVPILRKPSKKKRDGGKVIGFGEPTQMIDSPDNKLEGRMARFLKPLEVAS